MAWAFHRQGRGLPVELRELRGSARDVKAMLRQLRRGLDGSKTG